MLKEDLLYTLALTQIPRIGDITAKKLIAVCGSAKAVFSESRKALESIDGIGIRLATDIKKNLSIAAAEDELNFMIKNQISWYYYKSDAYPNYLKESVDGPILLFSRGNINLNTQRCLSVVGTRKITTYGQRFCTALIEALAQYNPIIISGFAYGVDITSQLAAANNNLQTIGCLAHGFNQMYPRAHERYVGLIEKNGGFVTDFWSTDSFKRNNFLKRNRIIAGLSQATVVIESAEKGGSLVTADIANSYNREVFAVPGRPHDLMSAGCNTLIKHHKANALTSPEDIPKLLNWDVQKPTIQKELFIELNQTEQKLYELIKEHQKISLDNLAVYSETPTYKVASTLLNLELKGLITPLAGKIFEIN